MDYAFAPLTEADRHPVIDIFNYFIENSFAAYPEQPVGYDMYDRFLQMTQGYPAVTVRDAADEVVGFAFLRPYMPVDSLRRAAEIAYFIWPDHTGHGLGNRILEHFKEEGRDRGLGFLLASISSLNEGSIRFHERHGFRHCGRFERIGLKKNREFDVVWMQLDL
jgi:phosphinothricin acetyltransferase